jgi:hypothetical protein
VWEEPFGMVMIEAMALGCPVISFARGAAPEIIVHRKTGFLVNNVNEMVRFMPRIAEIDREATRLYVERNFSAGVMVKKYVKIYNEVIKTAKEVPTRPFSDVVLTKPIKPVEAVPPAVKKGVPAQVAQVARVGAEANNMY